MTTQPAVPLSGRAPVSPGDFYVANATQFPHIIEITTGVTGIGCQKLVTSFTLATSGVCKGLQSDMTYEPATSGYATPIAVAGKVILAAGKEFTGGVGYMWGVQGQLDFQNGATLNNASSIFAALRGVITKSGTPVFTAFDTVAGLYIDNLCTTNLAGVGTYGSALASMQNHGGTLDYGILLRGNNKIAHVFCLNTFGGASPAIEGSTDRSIAIYIDDTTKYLRAYATKS